MRVDLHARAELDALAPDWEALFAADPDATPSLAPAFGDAWLRHWAAHEVEPWVLAARDGEELVGLAALVLRRRGPLRTLLPLGHWVGNWWDVLTLPARRTEAAHALAAGLADRRADWDALLVDTLVPGSPLGPALRAAGLRAHRRGTRPYPGMDLPPTFDAYLASLPRKRRVKLRRHLRRLDEGELELVAVEAPADLTAAVARWQEVRSRWWSERGKDLSPDHARPAFAAFLEAMLQRLVPAGRAVVWELRREGEPLGVTIDLRDARTHLCWLSAFEPAAASLSPGQVVIGESIRRAVATGRERYDFMLGDEPYKYWFGAVDLDVPRLLVHSRTPRSALTRVAVAAAGRARA